MRETSSSTPSEPKLEHPKPPRVYESELVYPWGRPQAVRRTLRRIKRWVLR